LADGRATRICTAAHPMPHPPTRLEKPNRKSPMTWPCLELGQGHQAHISTRMDHTTMTLHRNTAPTAMGHTEANSPSSEMCKRGETRESRGPHHSLNKPTQALPQTFSFQFTRLHWHLQELVIFGTGGSIVISPYKRHVWTHRSLMP
jgi:hypothetical protein